MQSIEEAVRRCAEETGWLPPDGPLGVSITSWFPSSSPDVDGPAKRTLDALQDALGINDNRVYVMILTKAIDPENPRMEIEVWGLESNEPGSGGRNVTEGSGWELWPGQRTT